jgi:hypothetical protein
MREHLLDLTAAVTTATFNDVALQMYDYQARHNALYREFVGLLGRPKPRSMAEIPFLPIRFFKSYLIQTGEWVPDGVFTSSIITGLVPSRHCVRDFNAYLQNTVEGITPFYGDPSEWCILALLPSYMERTGSSLVAMADHWIRRSRYRQHSGFFMHDFKILHDTIQQCVAEKIPTILLGVSFALLDFVEAYPMVLSDTTIVVMETGGMKGYRREITKEALHEALRKGFHISDIHSEYGMTELLSQAYSKGNNRFTPARTLEVFITEVNDPFARAAFGRPGTINVIDLANIDTCCFIATEDAGRAYADGTFEVLGRLDTAEMRGCNLLYES